MFAEDDLLQLSALQHLVFCERQCALIHIEQAWVESALTLEGRHMHQWVDEEGRRRELRGDVLTVRGLPLRSLRLGLSGRADAVEFHREFGPTVPEGTSSGLATAIPLIGLSGRWRPFPMEHKRGKPKPDACDEVQVCAQALCLEEMLGVSVPAGALFYGKTRHRHDVAFEPGLREETVRAAARLHALIREGSTPKAVKEPKCDRCSLLRVCLPEAMSRSRSGEGYLRRELQRALEEEKDSGAAR